MILDPQQELFIKIKTDIEAKGYAVYDSVLPPAGTPYPFVYLGNFPQYDSETKTQIMGRVLPTIHIWHNNPKHRGTVSRMMLDIKAICRKISRTTNYKWAGKITYQDIIPDKPDPTMAQPLLHGIIEAEFKFS